LMLGIHGPRMLQMGRCVRQRERERERERRERDREELDRWVEGREREERETERSWIGGSKTYCQRGVG
jgi:hypothetical protein